MIEIQKIIGISIIGVILSVTVKNYRPELGICCAIATGIVILALTTPALSSLITDIRSICDESYISTEYFEIILKIIGIAYITQFASELAKDAGEGAISKKLELAGKTSVFALVMPIIKALLELVRTMLSGF